jgi:hypothetical protein
VGRATHALLLAAHLIEVVPRVLGRSLVVEGDPHPRPSLFAQTHELIAVHDSCSSCSVEGQAGRTSAQSAFWYVIATHDQRHDQHARRRRIERGESENHRERASEQGGQSHLMRRSSFLW